MSKLPTAEDLALIMEQDGSYEELIDKVKFASLVAIEFAKIHVAEALKEAFLNSEMRVSENDTNETPSFTDNYDDGYVTITVSKESILNAYTLDLIK